MSAAVVLAMMIASQASADDAHRHFDEATRHYNLGEFDAALAEYKEAYRVAPLPAFLFNIGQCYFALGDYDKAVFFYEGFLRESPDKDHHAEVEGFLAEARRLAGQKKAEPAPLVTAATPAGGVAPPVVAPPATPVVAPPVDDGAWIMPAAIAGGVVVVAIGVVATVIALSPPSGSLGAIDARSKP